MQETKPLNWLQRLKDESWEAELLISAASIFAIFNGFELLNELINFFISYLPPNQYFYGYMISFGGYLALGILGAFFAIHFGLRAYWIGLVGLNSVFPDYSLKDSAYSEIYTKKMSDSLPKLPATINTLDEICSVILSSAFAILLIYLYSSIISFLILWLYNGASEYGLSSILQYLLVAIGLFLVLGFAFAIIANLKIYKNNERAQIWYYHSVMWSNKIFLGPFYRYVLQINMIFSSNFKKRKSIIITIFVMFAFGCAFAVFQVSQSNMDYLVHKESFHDGSQLYPNHYQTNNTEESFLLTPEIQSEIVTKQVLKLFIPLFEYEMKQMKESCRLPEIDTDDLDQAQRQIRSKKELDCYANNVTVLIDDQLISSDFLKTKHPITEQPGLLSFVDLAQEKRETHHLSIIKKSPDKSEKKARISFYFSPE